MFYLNLIAIILEIIFSIIIINDRNPNKYKSYINLNFIIIFVIMITISHWIDFFAITILFIQNYIIYIKIKEK